MELDPAAPRTRARAYRGQRCWPCSHVEMNYVAHGQAGTAAMLLPRGRISCRGSIIVSLSHSYEMRRWVRLLLQVAPLASTVVGGPTCVYCCRWLRLCKHPARRMKFPPKCRVYQMLCLSSSVIPQNTKEPGRKQDNIRNSLDNVIAGVPEWGPPPYPYGRNCSCRKTRGRLYPPKGAECIRAW